MGNEIRHSLIKPTIDTPFRIDFSWWMDHDNNWRIFLQGCLCKEHQVTFDNPDEHFLIDSVDPDTAEIHPIDGLQNILMTHCAKQPDFLTNHTTLVDSVFRVLLANQNRAMTAKELSLVINRPADTILRTLAGPKVYMGITPLIFRS